MADHSYHVEIQPDFLERITRAKPIQALAELIWNSLDADAKSVDVRFEYNELGAMSAIVVTDDGLGIPFKEAPDLFRRLGGSWKKPGATTKTEGRFLHGQDGRGRFKAFALGRIAEWDVAYAKRTGLFAFKVIMNANNIRDFRISDELEAPADRSCGVSLTISEPHKDYRAFSSESGIQELTEIFALYLADYRGVSITIDGNRLDPQKVIASRHLANLANIIEEGVPYAAQLEIIEWRSSPSRALYLCNQNGFPLIQVDRRFHIGSFQFSGYLKSPFIAKLQLDGTLELAEMNPAIETVINEAQLAIKDYFRSRAAEEARSVVSEWKKEEIYPFDGEPVTNLEKVERQVFDIVAVNVARHLPDFETTAAKNKSLNLRLLRHAIERSPEDLQLIFEKVLNLPKRKQEELAGLLRDVSLSAIISAAKTVADRLKFLTGLDAVLFDEESKKRLKERSQLHRIIAQNCWLFGEEFNLSVDDQSLTEVLRKHRKLLGAEIAIDEPVKHISKTTGIIDLMLSRATRRHRANDLTHLVVELKAPRVKVDSAEVMQIEQYAFSVAADERFRSVTTTWVFWVISDDYGDYASHRIINPDGLIHEKGNVSIYVKTWAQVLDENRARLQFFQERLEYQADKGAALRHLNEHYAQFLQGVVPDDATDESIATPSPEMVPQ